MPEPKSQKPEPAKAEPAKLEPAPWRVPVTPEEVGETGRHFDLVAEPDIRAATARLVGLRDLSRLEATFDVTHAGAAGLHVVGRVSATVGQNCVVTLEPLTNEIDETIDLVFAPAASPGEHEAADDADADDESRKKPARKWNAPEPLIDGIVDLGALATEFLILGLDPYPRKPGAVFEPPRDAKPDPGPFAALAKLAKDGHGS